MPYMNQKWQKSKKKSKENQFGLVERIYQNKVQKNVLVSTALLEWEYVARLIHLTSIYILINKKDTNLLWNLQHCQVNQIMTLKKIISKLYVKYFTRWDLNSHYTSV